MLYFVFSKISNWNKDLSLSFLDIFLIIISSAGLLHGLLFACYLCFVKKKKIRTNILLGLILILMAFRIGKSVMLNFGDGLEPMFIFAGLAILLLIGPLLRWYVSSMTLTHFSISKKQFFECIPFALVFIMSFFITKESFEKDKRTIIVLASALIFIYVHFAFYIYLAWKSLRKAITRYSKTLQTKSQTAILNWLQLLIVGFVIIWTSYFLNIIEDAVPYIIGPIMYSIAVYFLSYKAFQLKITDVDGSAFKNEEDNTFLFDEISKLIIDERRYLESDLSLVALSKLVGQSTQKTSSVINQHAKRNFNDFINFHRVQHAKKMLLNNENQKFTISSIAFETGFNSLSSFNSAFKKFEGITPSNFRKSKA